jgi:hypothetical protein
MVKEFTYYRTRFEARERIEGLDGEVNAAIVGKQSVHHASDDLQEIGKICNQCRQIFP